MVTIVNTPNSGNGDSGAGVAIIAVLAILILVALFVWPGYARTRAPADNGGANINVTLPAGSGQDGGAAQ